MQIKHLLIAAALATAGQAAFAGHSRAVTPERGWFARTAPRPDVTLAQATDPRVVQLEEQVRQMTGRIEELNFLLLQMQEQLRRMQEDNDFRFQQLEGGGTNDPERKSQAGTDENRVADGGAAATRGAAPRDLGKIVINPDGSIKGATLGEPMDLRGDGNGASPDETVVAALPETNDPEELYSNAYEFVLSGDYRTAEAAFREHIERFPGDQRAADARYWLGEAILSQQRPAEAAEVFLAASREFPDSRKAPDMLLKLGMSLAALGQRDIACATFKEVGVRYPGASDLLKGRVTQEQAIAGC
ncbi:MAG: tol-pal system protein YbgF [Rhizobiaceae bacterium]